MKTNFPHYLPPIRHPLTADVPADTALAGAHEDRFAHISFEGAPRKSPLKEAERRSVPTQDYAAPLHFERQERFNDFEVAFVRDLIARAGLNHTHYRMGPLVRRIPACLRVLKAATIEDAWAMVRTSPDLISKAVDSLLIGTTEFFRDATVFSELQGEIIPQLSRLGRPPRVWSVACSDGMELYSVAMMLGHHRALEGAHLLGTDCRRIAIERARRGIFSCHSIEKIQACYQGMFDVKEGRIRMHEYLRGAVKWEVADALDPAPEGGWDLILCRNFSIYLDPTAAMNLWRSLLEALNIGGILVVGKAEKPRLGGLVREAPSIYRKTQFSVNR
jgi:chemotaxis methyl-accepting protein methylase